MDAHLSHADLRRMARPDGPDAHECGAGRLMRGLPRGSARTQLAGTRLSGARRWRSAAMKHAGLRALFTVASLASCNVPESDARFNPVLPDRETFRDVAPVLAHACGTLDCHGSRSRNLLLYGSEGLRFSVDDRPLSPACATVDEIDQD